MLRRAGICLEPDRAVDDTAIELILRSERARCDRRRTCLEENRGTQEQSNSAPHGNRSSSGHSPTPPSPCRRRASNDSSACSQGTLAVSSRCLLEPTIEARRRWVHLLVARVAACPETCAVSALR